MGPTARDLDTMFALKDRLTDHLYKTTASQNTSPTDHLYRGQTDLYKANDMRASNNSRGSGEVYSVKERAMLQEIVIWIHFLKKQAVCKVYINSLQCVERSLNIG